jgi:purine-binding chemotaxis protein CheW
LRKRLGIRVSELSKHACIIITDWGSSQVGLLVDGIQGVIPLEANQIEPRPTLGNKTELQFITGLGKAGSKVVILINIEQVLAKDSLEGITKAA